METPFIETEVAAVVDKLFRRWPSLVGFSVGREDDELVLSDLETDPWPAHSPELIDEIASALHQLTEDEPDALKLLPGRTFARVLH
jgi:hypothetical protein